MSGLVTFFHVPTTHNEVTFHMLSLDFHVSFVYIHVHMHVCVCVGTTGQYLVSSVITLLSILRKYFFKKFMCISALPALCMCTIYVRCLCKRILIPCDCSYRDF